MPDMKAEDWPVTSCVKMAGKLRIVKRRQRSFKITGLTWIVQRTFAWLGRNRRFSKDYEYRVQTSETLLDIAATRLALNRLAPA
jgi:putative transposase